MRRGIGDCPDSARNLHPKSKHHTPCQPACLPNGTLTGPLGSAHHHRPHGGSMPQTISLHVHELVAAAERSIVTISPAEAIALHGGGEVVFVDLRDIRELNREGRVRGSFHCPRGMLEFWIDPDSKYHKPVFASGKEFVFYCNGAWRSALATDVAQQMGLPRVVEMDGGFTAWKNAGLPVAERAPRTKP